MHSLDLLIYPLDDLHCGYGIQQGNILPSYPYIPGRVLRGALGGWEIRVAGLNNTSDDFKTLFYDNEENSVSFPNCTNKGMLPAPLSLFKPKSCGEDQHAALFKETFRAFVQRAIPSGFVTAPIDFLRRKEMPSEVSATLKPLKNCSIDGTFIVNSPGVSLSIKSHHDEKIRRVGEDGLFIEEVIPLSNYYEPKKRYYKGTLYYSDQYKDLFEKLSEPAVSSERAVNHEKIENPDQTHMIFIGHRRVAALVYGINHRELVDNNEQVFLDKEFTITFTSDFMPKEFSYPLSASQIMECISGLKVEKKRVFCGLTRIHGYDVLGKKPNIPKHAFVAGSCIRLKCSTSLTKKEKVLLFQKSKTGIGLNTKNGYGRFKINWGIHDIKEAS